MAHTINVDIVSAEGQIYAGEASMVFVPATQGEIGIAPRHAPLLTTLKAGEVRVNFTVKPPTYNPPSQTDGADHSHGHGAGMKH